MKAIKQTHRMSRLHTRRYLAAILMLCGFLNCLTGALLACDPDPPCERDGDCETGEECCGGTCITDCDLGDCESCSETSGECESYCTDPTTPYCVAGNCEQCRYDTDCVSSCEKCSLENYCVERCALSECHWPRFCDTELDCFCVRCEIDYQCQSEGACHTCVDSECVGCASPTPWCKESDGTCINCDPASAGDCSVTDEDIGFDADDCVSNVAANGACYGGVGGHIAAWDQLSSTEEDATGPNTEDVAGCAIVQYAKCKNLLIGFAEGPLGIPIPVYDCVADLGVGVGGVVTEDMGTHKECP